MKEDKSKLAYISHPDNTSKAAAALGRKGGQVKTAKGFSTMDPERRSVLAKAAAAKRWDGKKKVENKGLNAISGYGIL
jgi:hypothetical protein